MSTGSVVGLATTAIALLAFMAVTAWQMRRIRAPQREPAATQERSTDDGPPDTEAGR